MLGLVLLLPACQPDTEIITIPIPTMSVSSLAEEEHPDDIVMTPNGWAYRANVHQEGVDNPWPPIQTTELALASGIDVAYVRYRDCLEIKAGETRNNILYVTTPDWNIQNLKLYTGNIPCGIEIAERERWYGFRAIAPVLIIEISQDTKPGEYNFEIKLEIDNKDCGTVQSKIVIV